MRGALFIAMITITISNAAWGYLTDLPDYTGGKIFKKGKLPLDGRHSFKPGLGDTIIPGVTDKSLLGNMPGGYGFVRPWDTEGRVAELALNVDWQKARVPRLDYYVAMINGSPCPDAVRLYYPERVFVTGEGNDGEDLDRVDILKHLRAVDIRATSHFWLPCQIFHGLKQGGIPNISAGLRSDTDMGASWYEVCNRLAAKLPAGYEWYFSGGRYGELFITEDRAKYPEAQ
jgi:hypothetical protein